MTSQRRVYVDSDVVISSILSHKGAAYILLTGKLVDLYISNYSYKEILGTAKRLDLNIDLVEETLKNIGQVELSVGEQKIKEEYEEYVLDPKDAHIIGGAVVSASKFLITYNLRHYNIDRLKYDLDIVVMQPGKFLQYLRSIQ